MEIFFSKIFQLFFLLKSHERKNRKKCFFLLISILKKILELDASLVSLFEGNQMQTPKLRDLATPELKKNILEIFVKFLRGKMF